MNAFLSVGLKRSLLGFLILGGAVEAVWGLLQIYGYEPSGHSLYALTGSFYNPGPYSGFLAMCLPAALCEWLDGKGAGKYLSMVALVLMLVVLPSGMSRSAWLAAALSSAYVLVMRRREKVKDLVRRHRMLLAAGCILLSVLAAGAYHWKKDSADGRLLMWKVAAQAVAERPWTGYGPEKVAGAYGEAQERYFASGKATEQEEHVAGAPEYVFNEYLQVAMAWGVPVLCVALAVAAGCFAVGHRHRLYGACGGLLSLGVFAFSSYPFQFAEFRLGLVVLMAACFTTCRSAVVRTFAWTAGIGLGFALCPVRQERNIRLLFDEARGLHQAGAYEASIEKLEKLMEISSDAMILNIIGKNHQALGQCEAAEEWFLRSTRRLPNRIYPYYLLAKLYAEHPDCFPKEKLEWAARMVEEKEPKVQSTAIRQMREEIRRIIKEVK